MRFDRRKRFLDIVNHNKTDGILVDFGGCPLSTVSSPSILDRLNDFLGFGKVEGYFDERMLDYYDIDTRSVGDIFFPHTPHYKIIEDGKLYRDEWGVVRQFTGKYWDIVENPLKDATLDDVKNYPFPELSSIDSALLDAYEKRAKYLFEQTDKIVVASHPVYGIFELGCWMFGFDDFLYRMAAEPMVVESFFKRVLDYQLEVTKLYYSRIGKYIHITTSGDDFATQSSTFFSKNMFDNQIAPFLKERIKVTKQYTNAKFLHHSCGSVAPLIPSLIDCGVDILNPIQPCSPLMTPQNLSKYSNDIVFHGGFDTQAFLPQCNPQQIDEKVNHLINEMKGSSYIFATAHNIQDDVPIENINALFTASKKYKNF